MQLVLCCLRTISLGASKLHVVCGFLLFPALYTTVAPRQLLNEEGRDTIDGLDLALITCTHSTCVARLTL